MLYEPRFEGSIEIDSCQYRNAALISADVNEKMSAAAPEFFRTVAKTPEMAIDLMVLMMPPTEGLIYREIDEQIRVLEELSQDDWFLLALARLKGILK